MSLIDGGSHVLLTAYVIKLLKKNGILSYIDFIKESSQKLTKITNLSWRDITDIKNDILENHAAKSQNGWDLSTAVISNSFFCSTGIESFDQMIGGGLMTGNINEFCGLPASGKTQVCGTIAIHLAHHFQFDVMYIDTKRDFSAIRLHKILETKAFTPEVVTRILQNIKVESINTLDQLLLILQYIDENLETHHKNCRLIIIDSLASLWFLHQGEQIKIGMQQLTRAANLMRKIAIEHQCLILVTNIVSRWTSGDDLSQKTRTTLLPAMGKFWQSVPSNRFLISEINDDNIANCSGERIITILKSNQYKSSINCTVHITNEGVI